MAFKLYRTTDTGTSSRYSYVADVPLAGNGLIYSACRKHLNGKDVGWTITNTDMLTDSGYEPSQHALVIDIAPRRSTLNLYEVRSISGYSYPNWTPLLLKMEMLFADLEVGNLESAKSEFDDSECERIAVREFLYLTGGYSEGNWNWGGNSRTTAVLLFDDAWEYFRRVLGADSAAPPC